MIKCFWYWKLLKQFFIISLISCFGLLGSSFVNAWTVQTVWLQDSPSIYDNQYNLTFLKGGSFKSMFLWQWKGVLALNSWALSWRMPDWNLYFQAPWFQWYFWQYASCDEITWLNYTPSNCSYNTITWDYVDLYKNFFKNVVAWDYVYYDYVWYDHDIRYENYSIYICFSSHSIWKSICFIRDYNYFQWVNRDFWTLINSQNFDYTFASIPQSLLWYAPWQAGYNWWWNIDWESVEVSQSQLTWNTMYANCSKRMAFEWYRANGYKTRMCYSSWSNNNEIFSWKGSDWSSNFVLTGLTYDDVYIDTANLYRFWNTGAIMSDVSWLDYWRKSFEVYNRYYNNQVNVNNPFNGVPVSLFMLMWNVYTYWKPYNSASIVEFCIN